LISPKLTVLANHFKTTIKERLLHLQDIKLKAVKKEHIEAIIRPLTRLLDGVMKRSEVGEIVETTCLAVALNSFRSPYFDKKLYGLNYISEMVENVKRAEDTNPDEFSFKSSARWVTRLYLVEWIQSNHILETVFGESAHPQLIQRAGDLIKLLAQQGALQMEQLGMILARAKDCHETQAASVFGVLSTCACHLSLEFQHHIEAFVTQIPFKSYTAPLIKFVSDLSKFIQDSNLKMKFTDLLWHQIAQTFDPAT